MVIGRSSLAALWVAEDGKSWSGYEKKVSLIKGNKKETRQSQVLLGVIKMNKSPMKRKDIRHQDNRYEPMTMA